MSALRGYAGVHEWHCTPGRPGGETDDEEGSDRASDREGTDVDPSGGDLRDHGAAHAAVEGVLRALWVRGSGRRARRPDAPQADRGGDPRAALPAAPGEVCGVF